MNKTIYIDNKLLLERIHKVVHEITRGREHAVKTMIDEGVLRTAFGVKTYEFDNKDSKDFDSYARKQINTNNDIIRDFKMYIGFYKDLPEQRFNHSLSIKQYIESVGFFNESLSNDLKIIARQEKIEGV
ncbi:hypothetical protein [Mammaliicoccus vitulinus]|uniref:hypothetical protein n=1 Tax=Mammaliicoccus vitulinus TaxID=71237 RepID=UPI00248A9D3B|nr:hypothetical protein [Mammaliicoccus vitulinus]